MSSYTRDLHKTKISDFYCKKCGFVIPLPRSRKQREKGHVKDVWCPHCKDVTQHDEVRSVDFTYENVKVSTWERQIQHV